LEKKEMFERFCLRENVLCTPMFEGPHIDENEQESDLDPDEALVVAGVLLDDGDDRAL
jgi:hypothetical protein